MSETRTCSCSHSQAEAEIRGWSVTQVPTSALPIESAPYTATLDIPITQSPAIHVTKASTTTSITAAGQVVPYTFTVTNAGNMTLTAITVTDPNCDAAPARSEERRVGKEGRSRDATSPQRETTPAHQA